MMEEADLDLNYEDSLMPSCVFQSLCDLWKSDTLCDVLITAEGRHIPAHKVVLAAASPYFRAMFTCKLREASENKVEMHEISFKLLQDVISFIYTCELKVTDENVYGLMSIADILQLSSIRTACTSYLLSSLSPSNCLSVLTAASLHNGYNDLADAAVRYARKHLCDVAKCEEFMVAPVDILLKVIQGRVLNVPDEGHLLKIIISWVKHDPIERLKDLDKLSLAIHLFQVPMDTLVQTKQDPVVQNTHLEHQIKHTINTILEERYDSGDARTIWATGYKERARRMLRFCDDQDVILALGGESNGMAVGSVECLTLGYDNWKCAIPTAVQSAGGKCEDSKVIPTMRTHRSFFGVCYTDDKVYVAGGSTPTTPINAVEVFSVKKNEWSVLPPLPSALTGGRMAFLHGQLTFCGGQNEGRTEKAVWYLDERSACWKVSTPMFESRAFHGLVSIGGILFAIGGKNGDGTLLSSVERYDPGENRWFTVSPLHDARYDFGCVAIGHYIYVVGGIGQQYWLRSVERYNTLTNQWHFLAEMPRARASFGITVSDNRIYCVGGYDGTNYSNQVDKFNPRTNRWHCVQAMQCRRYGVGAATLRIPVISREEP